MKIFPTVEGSNLERRKFKLPLDLEGELNVVIVPFKQYQQFSVNEWMPYLKEFKQRFPSIEYYEVPTLAKGYTAMRFVIDGGMRSGIPSIETRNRTITLYINKRKFKRKLGIETENIIYIYLLKDEKILWETTGTPTDDKVQKLEKNIKENLSK
jgi:hypothetical protein